jgi:hypothetical protein
MHLTKKSISTYYALIPGIEGYYIVIDKIEENKVGNPDIAIEACKSLIEGLSKKALELLSDDYISKKSLRKECDNKLPTLIRTAFNQIYRHSFQIEIHESLYKMIHDKVKIQKLINSVPEITLNGIEQSVLKIAAIRDNRGDLSHGRIYPKNEESDVNLANSICSITDGICSFMIHEIAFQYKIKIGQKDMLVYDLNEEFNQWLDETHNVSVVKIDFSRILYDNAYDKYEEIYYTEYLELQESSGENEDKEEEFSSFDGGEEPDESSINCTSAEQLVNEFDVETFWNEKKHESIQRFAHENNLNSEGLEELIENYLFSEMDPLRDEVVAIMNVKPKLQERQEVTKELISKIIELADLLRIIDVS